ncbi:MAG: alpha/beta fold hydrolase [Nakamurella sp.]
MTLPDGRVLEGRSVGPSTGRPVLFIAGAGTGKSMVFGNDLLNELGVRLLCADRPGMGGSTPDIGRTADSTAADYAAFVAAVLGGPGRPLPVVANSQGSVFGLALAAAGGASVLLLVSPADDVAHPRVRELLAAQPAGLVDLVNSDGSAAADLLHGFTAADMERFVLDSASARDRAVYTDAAFAAVFRLALAEGFAGNGLGYVTDTLIAMTRWTVDFGSIRTPTTILMGSDDLTHSPDQGEFLASRIPAAERHVIPHAGGSLLWTHARQVLLAAIDR